MLYPTSRMNYHYQKVNSKIADYVRSIVSLGNASNREGTDLPLFTRGMSALLCRRVNESYKITLYGQSVPDEAWSTQNNHEPIAFFFKPFAMGTIFKISAQELKEKPVDLNLWNAQKAIALSLQLHHCKSVPEQVDALSFFIHAQLESNQRDCEIIRYATDTIMQNSNADSLSLVLDELSLTERTFQRIFKKYVGITANEYRRLCQHYFAFSHLKSGHFEKLADVAYANGYFDQSHYIRSFKEFTNTTPNEYLQSGLDKGN